MLVKTKISKNIGLKIGEKNGVDQFDNVFVNHDMKAGTEIEMTEKEANYVRDAVKRFIKAQKILEKYLVEAEG